MPRIADFDAVPHEPSLDPFRRSIGHLLLDGDVAGFIATQVDCVATRLRGRLWWSSWSLPQEFLMVLVTASSEESPLPEFNDPWLFIDQDASTIRDLHEGIWEEPDRRDHLGPVVSYEIRWLTGHERDAAWAKHGFDPFWDNPSGQHLLP